MSFAAIAKVLFNAQSVKNVPLDASKARLAAEELKLRTSALGIAQILSKSKILESILMTKMDKIKKEIGDEESKKKIDVEQQAKKKEFEFKAYTLRTMMAMRRKVDLLSNIVEKNNLLVNNLVNDLGKYKKGKATNVKNPGVVRFGAPSKTVKGKIDQINKDIQALKEVKYKSRKLSGVGLKKPTKKEQEIINQTGDNGMGFGALGAAGLLASPAMRGLLMKGLSWGAIASLPFGIRNTVKMFNGERLSDNPIDNYLARKATPAMMGVGTYALASKLTPKSFGGTSYADKKSMQVAKIMGRLQGYKNFDERFANDKSHWQGRRDDASKIRNKSAKMKKLWEITKAERAAQEKAARSAAKLEKFKTVAAGAERQVAKYSKLSNTLFKLGRKFPALGLAYAAYAVSNIGGIVSDYKTGAISKDQYKNKMVEAYGDLAGTLGSAGVGALLGGLAGSAFPVIGTIGGIAVGGVTGMAAEWFMGKEGYNNWIGLKLYEVLNEDKQVDVKKKGSAGGAGSNSTTSKPAATTSAGNAPTTAPEAAASATGGANVNSLPADEKAILLTIKEKESGGKNIHTTLKGTSSGYYQFTDGTWQAVSKKAGIGTEYKSAMLAPAEVQDAVAAFYVKDILAHNNNDVTKVPLVWYSGNAQGKMSQAAMAANRGLTAEKYQADWMKVYAKYAPKGNDQTAAPGQATPTAQTASPGQYTVKTKSGLVLSTAVGGDVIKGSMTDQQYATLVAEADSKKATWANLGDPTKERVAYLQGHYAPEVVRAFEAKQNSMNPLMVQRAPEVQAAQQAKQNDETTQQTVVATALAAATADKTSELARGQEIMMRQLDDTRRAVVNDIGFPRVIGNESSFSSAVNRRK